jgi:O-antigen/teichoic acid export membrane protein
LIGLAVFIWMQEFKADSSVRRILKNGAFGLAQFTVFALSGFFFIPFLVRSYGSGTYGLIALAGFLTQYIGLLSRCVSGAVARYMNVSLNKNDWQQANEIFSTALISNICSVLLLIPVFAAAVWKLEWIIDFPPEKAIDFRIMVACNVAVFLITLVKGVIFTPIFAANRLDINDMFQIGHEILRLILLFILISTVGPYLWIIGVVELGISILTTIIGIHVYLKMVQSQLRFKWKNVCLKWVKPILTMAGWTVVASLGQLLFIRTDVLILNRMVNMELAGICAALLLWPNFIQQIAKKVSGLLMPVYMIDYAKDRADRIREVALLLSKVFAIFSLVVVGLTMLFGGWMLELWIDSSYRQYHIYMVLMLVHFPLTLSREAIWIVFPAYDEMQYVGKADLLTGVFNVVLSVYAVMCGFGLAGVIVATGLSLIIQRSLMLSRYTAHLLEFSYLEVVKI